MDKDKYQKPNPDAWREHASEYEQGFIDGMLRQVQSSVDKAVNAMCAGYKSTQFPIQPPMQFHEWFYSEEHRQKYDTDHPVYLAAEEAWIAGRAHMSMDKLWDVKRQERLRRYMDKETTNEAP
jgi:hypothetical protein